MSQPTHLIDLERWNAGVRHQNQEASNRSNGIACPKCGAELRDTLPIVILTSAPPRKDVNCVCGWKGTRVA